MNPADVAQSGLPIASADVSLIALFLQAHWIVKAVMLGLLACSVWVWAIAIDKIFLYSRTKRAMDRFEQAFWPGQSIGELYRPRNRAARTPASGAGARRFRRAVRRSVRHGLGHHVELPVDRRLQEYLAGGGGPGYRGSAVCHRDRPYRRHSGDYFLQ